MSDTHSDPVDTPRTKQTEIEDLATTETTNADEVKGGVISSTTSISAGMIIPCVRTIKGSGL
jgi:hypothetical protein